jgi:C_GCAxxG_C_C family probable redox protein
MNSSNDQILEKAYELGQKYESECTGCAQTTIAAIFEALDIWSDDVFNAASGLANGLGLTGDGTCGALIGASMVISYLFPREHKDFKEMYKPMKSYGLVKKLHSQFIRKYGVCRCYDIQKSLMGVTWNLWDLSDLNEEMKSEMVQHCSELVGNVAKLATKIILENGFNPQNK